MTLIRDMTFEEKRAMWGPREIFQSGTKVDRTEEMASPDPVLRQFLAQHKKDRKRAGSLVNKIKSLFEKR